MNPPGCPLRAWEGLQETEEGLRRLPESVVPAHPWARGPLDTCPLQPGRSEGQGLTPTCPPRPALAQPPGQHRAPAMLAPERRWGVGAQPQGLGLQAPGQGSQKLLASWPRRWLQPRKACPRRLLGTASLQSLLRGHGSCWA